MTTVVDVFGHAGRTYQLGRDVGGSWYWRPLDGAWSRPYLHRAGALASARLTGVPRPPARPALRRCAWCTEPTRGRARDERTGRIVPGCEPGSGCGVGLPTAPPASGGAP